MILIIIYPNRRKSTKVNKLYSSRRKSTRVNKYNFNFDPRPPPPPSTPTPQSTPRIIVIIIINIQFHGGINTLKPKLGTESEAEFRRHYRFTNIKMKRTEGFFKF